MAFEEIKAKLGLDITDFEKGMLDANRAAKQAAAAQAKLADFRRTKALEEASDLGKVKILQGELVQLYNLRKNAVAGSAPYLQTQLEIEKKMVEIGKVRAQQKANEVKDNQSLAATAGINLTAAMRSRAGSALADAGGAAAGAGIMGALSGKSRKILEGIKSIGGALGASGALAGLIPGIGWASVAVAGIVYGFKKVKEYTDDVAARAKEIRDIMENIGKIRFQRAFNAMDDKEKLKTLEDQVDQAYLAWRISTDTARNNEDDLRSVKAAQDLETARNALADHRATMQKKANQNMQLEADQVDAINQSRSDALSDEIAKKEGLRYLQMRLDEAEKNASKQGLTKLQRAQALVEVDKARKEVNDKISENEQKMIDEVTAFTKWYDNATSEVLGNEIKKTGELKKQREELKKQGRAIQDNMDMQRRESELPTMAEVISGKRNIGSIAKNRATTLEKARAKELRLSDAEQRAREAYANAPTESAKAAALAQGKSVRGQLDLTRSQVKNLEKSLGMRIKDADPYVLMIKELASVNKGISDLNNKLEPNSIK